MNELKINLKLKLKIKRRINLEVKMGLFSLSVLCHFTPNIIGLPRELGEIEWKCTVLHKGSHPVKLCELFLSAC